MNKTELFDRVNNSFARQGLMRFWGAQLQHVDAGSCEIWLAFSDKVSQQQGTFHGGALGALADIAGGYAALTLAPAGMEVTTVEYKINFLAACTGGILRAKGRVLKAGKRVMVTSAEVWHVDSAGASTLCAVLQQTIVPVPIKS